MVSKITLFEPHFDGAQIGPASLGGDTTDLGLAESERAHDSAKSEPSTSSRLPNARLFAGVAGLATGLLAGFLAWRRFRSSSKAETDEATESTNEPMIEERPVTDRSRSDTSQ